MNNYKISLMIINYLVIRRQIIMFSLRSLIMFVNRSFIKSLLLNVDLFYSCSLKNKKVYKCAHLVLLFENTFFASLCSIFLFFFFLLTFIFCFPNYLMIKVIHEIRIVLTYSGFTKIYKHLTSD